MNLWKRLFLAIGGVSVLTLSSYAIWQQYSFKRGFLSYLDAAAMQRLSSNLEPLIQAYEQDAWRSLRSDPRALGRLMMTTRAPMAAPDGPPPGGPGGPRAPMPPGPPPPNSPPPLGELGRDEPMDLMGRLALHDAAGELVSGNAAVPLDSPKVVLYSHAQPIGTLYMAQMPGINGLIQSDFNRVQRRDAIWIGFIAALFALLVAGWLARRLSAPLRSLVQGAQALQEGNYQHRLPTITRDEFADLSEHFNRLAQSLEQHRHARQQSGAELAHELRTPISILQGELQLLQEGVRPLNLQAIDSLISEVQRLHGVVEDLYELALADSAELDYRFESLDLSALLQRRVALHQPQALSAGLQLRLVPSDTLQSECLIEADGQRLTRLIDNLILNARRYTDAPGLIEVRLLDAPDSVRLIVRDSAPGVASEEHARLFARFYRIEKSRSRAFGGAGLGLAICQAIAHSHGGTICAEHSGLGGLQIVVCLPRQQINKDEDA